jgi:hypothetical protein
VVVDWFDGIDVARPLLLGVGLVEGLGAMPDGTCALSMPICGYVRPFREARIGSARDNGYVC